MKTLSALDSKVLDINSESLGVSVDSLMENAGCAIVTYLYSHFKGKRIAFICGTGNNGGDGIVAASKMDPTKTTIFLLKPKKYIHSSYVKYILKGVKCPVRRFPEFDETKFDILVDCVLGTGIDGNIRAPYDKYISKANSFKGIVVSVDIPSGLGTDLSVNPDMTITFHAPKDGMDNKNSGGIFVTDIGIPKKTETIIGPGDMLRYPIPKNNGHKGNNGRLLIIGGGPYFGAPTLAALAAMRVGVDIVRVATPNSCSRNVASVSPVLMVTELDGTELDLMHIPSLIKLSRDYDAVLIGPGLGTSGNTRKAIREFVDDCDIPMVIDADGITALGKNFIGNERMILTPHRKEFESLGFTPDYIERPEELQRVRATILLKGLTDVIWSRDKMKTNMTGSSGMTSAGTGDVLAGITSGLLSKGMGPFDAACLGAYISGKAGEFAFEERSYGLIATDVIDMIPKVLKEGLRR